LRPALLAFLAVPVAFAAASPYFFLDFDTALLSLRGEARSTHRGADGLPPDGNFLFYAGDVIPSQLGGPGGLLAGLGIALALVRRAAGPRLLALFVAALLVGICLSPLHWARWAIPILPLLALFAAATLEAGLAKLLSRLGRERWQGWAFVVGLLALIALPATRTGYEALRGWRPTTRLQARDWLIATLPAGARIVVERGSAPLLVRQQMLDEQLDAEPRGLLQQAAFEGRAVDVLLVPSLPSRDSLEDYLREGYRYAVTAFVTPGPSLRERGLTAKETSFYEELFAKGRELAAFDPDPTRAGSAIRIWELPAASGPSR
jgi:4-amino-4-deoxy-L-arabinose transferase-like glycosyltransferase